MCVNHLLKVVTWQQTTTLRPCNGLFSRTTWVNQHRNGEPFWILLAQKVSVLMKQEMMEWQWHQLDHMQIICTSLQTDSLMVKWLAWN